MSGPATPSASAAAANEAAVGSMCGSAVVRSQTPATSKNADVPGILGPARNSARPSRPTLGMNQLPSRTRIFLLPSWRSSARATAEIAGGRWSGSTAALLGGEEEEAIATTTLAMRFLVLERREACGFLSVGEVVRRTRGVGA